VLLIPAAVYLTRMPRLLHHAHKALLWRVPTGERVLYLTFDDGPHPEVTPWVLDRLKEHDARATFFCVGRNAREHPAVMARIRREGHAVGNHTWDHRDAWRTPTRQYLRSVLRCQAETTSKLFRPPYGHIGFGLTGTLGRRFTIVMWDVLSADFDTKLGGEACLRNVVQQAGAGSIVVFHDSAKAWPRLQEALPGTLTHFANEGYSFLPLP